MIQKAAKLRYQEPAMANEKKQVFYIDDEPEMIELVRLILGRKGYQVSGASSGREGLTALCQCQDPPDLVLLDLMMPDMDGWEVYQQMKANEGTRDIPVIVITAKADCTLPRSRVISPSLLVHKISWKMSIESSQNRRRSDQNRINI
jgi:CheY-like chemotaxis protein